MIGELIGLALMLHGFVVLKDWSSEGQALLVIGAFVILTSVKSKARRVAAENRTRRA